MVDVRNVVVCELGALDDVAQPMVPYDGSCRNHHRVAHSPHTLGSNNRQKDDLRIWQSVFRLFRVPRRDRRDGGQAAHSSGTW